MLEGMSPAARRPLAIRFTAFTVTVLLILAVGDVAGVGAARASTAPAPVTSVRIQGFKFVPNKFAVTAGTPIRVKNKDSATHDLVAVNGAFKTPYIRSGKSAKFTVKKPGTYKIVCTLHTYMTGVLKAS